MSGLRQWLEERWVVHPAFNLTATGRVMQLVPGMKAYIASRNWSTMGEISFAGWRSAYHVAPPPGFERAYKCESRHADILAREPYLAILKLANWWEYHRWILEEWGISLGLLRSPVECDYYQNYRFDPPDLWGTPVRRHEPHLAGPAR